MALSEVEPPHEYMALSKVGPPQVPLRGACGSTRPVRVHHSLRLHLLYWNSMRDQSEGLFRGLSSNPNQGCPGLPRADDMTEAYMFIWF